MSRERSTIDTWEIHVNYGQGWEHECTEFTFADGRAQARTYRENCVYPIRVVRKRMKKSDLQPGEEARILKQILDNTSRRAVKRLRDMK